MYPDSNDVSIIKWCPVMQTGQQEAIGVNPLEVKDSLLYIAQ